MKNKKALFVGLRPIIGFVFGLIVILIISIFIQGMIGAGGSLFFKVVTFNQYDVDTNVHIDAEIYEKTASSACDISLMNFLRYNFSEKITYAEQLAVNPSDAKASAEILLDDYIANKGGTYSLKSESFEIGELSGEAYSHCQQIIPSKTAGETILVTLEFGGKA